MERFPRVIYIYFCNSDLLDVVFLTDPFGVSSRIVSPSFLSIEDSGVSPPIDARREKPSRVPTPQGPLSVLLAHRIATSSSPAKRVLNVS